MKQSKYEVVLDTETTGLDPYAGHRMVEIGCVELKNYIPTGRVLHKYINPERDMPSEAYNVHGLSEQFLRGFPVFKDVYDEIIDFIGDRPMVIHNAAFDMKFMNAEFEWLGKPRLPYAQAIDTLKIAKQKFPGSRVNLDALCKRFEIDNSSREKHGALLDAELLAAVYLELVGGKQPGFSLGSAQQEQKNEETKQENVRIFRTWESRKFELSDREKQAHQTFLSKIKNPIWSS